MGRKQLERKMGRISRHELTKVPVWGVSHNFGNHVCRGYHGLYLGEILIRERI